MKNLVLFLVLLILTLAPQTLLAYIGPGAGFAFLTSFLVLFTTILLAFFSIMVWPIRYLFRVVRKRKAYTKSSIESLIIVGLDGMDPTLAEKYMSEGKLPNFAKLKETGSFKPLQSTCPSASPVAWSSFMTGVNPGRHNIYDFLSRDKKTYLPDLSSASIKKGSKSLNIGKYSIPLKKPSIKLFRKSQPFWKILGEHGVFSSILRVPITFPPERFKGLLLSAMCVPDLKGTQGTFSFYTTREDSSKHTGGIVIPVILEEGSKIKSYIDGPENSISRKKETLRIPFTATLNPEAKEVELELPDQILKLKKGEYSDWIRLTFNAGLGIKVYGICRFFVTEISPHFGLYISPIHIDPENPALPISHPFFYSIYLAKLLGPFATLGLAEDTWALNEGILDEDAFLKQCYMNHEEREKVFFHTLNKTKRGVCVCVFDTTDRIQHMFWRYLEDGHPANRGKEGEKYKGAIEELYKRMDKMLGQVMEKIDNEKTVLFVMSDHGFKSFKRGVNLNSWLYLNGYLALKNGQESKEWFKNVDWENTKAYAFGLGGVYINLKGREKGGIVEPGKEFQELKKELIQKLKGLRDTEKDKVSICDVFDAESTYLGPYASNAPDMIVGYNKGYRTSWDSAVGKVNSIVFEDNIKSWSGDHCIDPKLVPGILFCNRKIKMDNPRIFDIPATVLNLFGIELPAYMEGKPLI